MYLFVDKDRKPTTTLESGHVSVSVGCGIEGTVDTQHEGLLLKKM